MPVWVFGCLNKLSTRQQSL